MSEVTEEAVYAALRTVQDPELNHNIVELGFIQELDIVGDYVRVDIQLTTPTCPFANQIVERIRAAVAGIEGVRTVEVARVCLQGE